MMMASMSEMRRFLMQIGRVNTDKLLAIHKDLLTVTSFNDALQRDKDFLRSVNEELIKRGVQL